MTTRAASTFYDFVDHPLSQLRPWDSAIITTMRIWAKGAMARTCPVRLIAPRFMLSGNSEALMPFHTFMITLGRTAARAVGLNAQEDGPITEDQAFIFAAFASIQNRDIHSARLALASLIQADGLGVLINKAVIFVNRSQSSLRTESDFRAKRQA